MQSETEKKRDETENTEDIERDKAVIHTYKVDLQLYDSNTLNFKIKEYYIKIHLKICKIKFKK